jgi:hypothetical protein
MSIWISRPVILFPPNTGRARDVRFDFYLNNAATAYDQVFSGFGDITDQIDSDHPEAETIAGAALRLALLDASEIIKPSKVFDCRSSPAIGSPSPSYKLLMKAGMERAVPLCLQGQYGTEAIQALLFGLLEQQNGGALMALSALNWPLQSQWGGITRSAAVGAAMLLTNQRPRSGGFRLLAAATSRDPIDSLAAVRCVMADTMQRVGIVTEAPSWAIVHNGPSELIDAVTNYQPQLVILKRATYLNTDFGCADLMVSLKELEPTLPIGTPGILVGTGRSGMAGAIIVIPDL